MRPQDLINGEIYNDTFGGGVAETALGPGVLVLAALAIVLILTLRRRLILVPLMFALFLLPFGQTLVLGGVHLYVSRIVIAVALLRAVTSRPSKAPLFGAGYNTIDKLFILWAILRASTFVLRSGEVGSVVNQVGVLWDVLGGYLVIRFLIQDEDDALRVTKMLCAIVGVLGLTLLYEKLYDVNLYAFLAGSPIIPEIRQGAVRAKGPFHHAILAGTFAATLLPLFVWLWKSKKASVLGASGLLASAIVTAAAASSTPVGTFGATVCAMCLWPFRQWMRAFRWGLLIGIVFLNFAMHAPVWWALEHIDLAGGSAGEHRAELIDNFVRHFGDWWLIGTNDNAKWGFEMWDLSNQFVAEGEQGGLAGVICFVAMICICFKWVGISRKRTRGDRGKEWWFWLLGVALFANVVAFFGISYFDQTRYSWYILLAMISVATASLRSKRVPQDKSDALDTVAEYRTVRAVAAEFR